MADPVQVDAWSASDYAGLSAGPWSFYYGYEWGYDNPGTGERGERWGFTARHATRGLVLSMPFEDLERYAKCKLDRLDPVAGLLVGVGLVAAGMKGTPAEVTQ